MKQAAEETREVVPRSRPIRPPGLVKRTWRRVRGPLASSAVVKHALAATISGALGLVVKTNRRVPGSHDITATVAGMGPAIYVLWHGQHLLAATLARGQGNFVAMVSRSEDAELNALVAARQGVETVRGSGGRDRMRSAEKGGARALIALKKALDAGKSVVMIADIPHGTPRQAGLGVVTLSRISGRPIVPVAIATSRRKVLEKSWDKTTINLPFGRMAVLFGDLVEIDPAGSDEALEAGRARLTDNLDDVTRRAYDLVDAQA